MKNRNQRKARHAQIQAPAEAAAQVEALAAETTMETPAAVETPVEVTETPAPVQTLPETPVVPVAAADKSPRRNNFPQFMGKRLFHTGNNVNWPKHVVDTGSRSEALVKENNGIRFEDYIASKGSVSRLCYMVQKGGVRVIDATAVEAKPEAPAEEATTEAPEATAAAAE